MNYTNDIEYLLQLEYETMNYIEANITNQYCRNYLKAALCVTIYPPCDESGIQKLCSEQCDELLNSGQCSYDTRYIIEYINTNVASNSSINFTFTCVNSLSFSNSFLNVLPCQSSKCIHLADIAEIPPR